MTTTSERIKERLRQRGVRFHANDAIVDHLEPGDLDAIEAEVAHHAKGMLNALVIDTEGDHNTKGTAKRIAKMYVREVFAGRFRARPDVTDFPNASGLDELYTVGPVSVRSTCSHHLCPVLGNVWVGMIPGSRVIGLSKFARIASWILERPQIQEEAVMMLADEIESLTEPVGLAVVLKASHSCMTWRGVREHDTTMVTSVVRGALKDKPEARAEFMALIAGQRFNAS